MDNELYRYVARETGYDQDALQEVFEESERRRALGASFTKADYLRGRIGRLIRGLDLKSLGPPNRLFGFHRANPRERRSAVRISAGK